MRTAYWRAVSATRLRSRLASLEGRVHRALKDTRALVSKGDSSPLTALTYERELVEIQREIRKLDQSELEGLKQAAELWRQREREALRLTLAPRFEPEDPPPIPVVQE